VKESVIGLLCHIKFGRDYFWHRWRVYISRFCALHGQLDQSEIRHIRTFHRFCVVYQILLRWLSGSTWKPKIFQNLSNLRFLALKVSI